MRKPSKDKNLANRKDEGNLYDKILKENLMRIFLPLITEKLKITVKKIENIPAKTQSTVEREMDGFLLITTEKGTKVIIHIEFQAADDLSMIYRIGEQHGMELRKYRCPIHHFVVYLGEHKPNMRTELYDFEIYKGFELINVKSENYEKMLNSESPEMVLMTILGDFPQETAELIVFKICQRLRALVPNPKDLKKYFEQLIILSRLRKFETLTTQTVYNMPITYDIETDGLYLMGMEKGMKKGMEKLESLIASEKEKAAKALKTAKEKAEKAAKAAKLKEEQLKLKRETELFESVRKMLAAEILTIKQIAHFTNASEEKIQKIKAQLEAEKPKKQKPD